MLTRIFSRFLEPTYVLMRVFGGLLFACHGTQKLFGWMGGSVRSEPLMIAAALIELFGGLAIAIGLLTQLMAFITAGEMAVAYLMAHATLFSQPFSRGFWPIENRGELALLYMLMFLFIMARGSGRWSVDTILFKPSAPEETPRD